VVAVAPAAAIELRVADRAGVVTGKVRCRREPRPAGTTEDGRLVEPIRNQPFGVVAGEL